LKTRRLSNFFLGALALLMILMPYGHAQASPVYSLSVSSNANRSNAVALQGAILSGSVYVFTSYTVNLQNYNLAGISKVCYWLDNPTMTGRATHCESAVPYDFTGTAGGGTEFPWGTSGVANGSHAITQLVTLSGGGNEVDSATFSVGATAVAPSITGQPASQSITAGQSASFSVAAAGTAPLSYQWKKNGTTISGATSSSYSTPATTSSDNGEQFTVVVSNTAGSVISNAAALTVTSSSGVGPAPGSIVMLQNANSKLCIDTGGSAGFSYLIQTACSTSKTQQFTLTSSPASGWYYLVSSASNLCWDIAGGSPSAGALIQQYSCTAVAPEYYQLKAVSGGYEILSGNLVNGCIDVIGASTASGANLEQNICNGAANQVFGISVVNSGGSTSQAQVSLVPTSVSFSNVVVNTTNTQTIKLTNSGTANLIISQITVSGNGFSASGLLLPLTLSPGQSSNFNVAFAPTAASSVSGSVSLVSNAPNSPATLTLSGTSVTPPPPTVAITSPTNGATLSGTITVAGTASDAVGVSSVQLQVDGGPFSSASGTTNWTFGLDAASLSNAAHTLTARATNTSGLTATTTVSVNVSNSGTIINVLNYGATGNGSTDDTGAINNAIAALQPGYELYFPCGIYIVSSQLTAIVKNNITIDGQLGCSSGSVTIKNTGSSDNLLIGDTSLPHTSYINLNATVSELSNTFTGNFSSIGLAPGDYISISQGGVGGNTSGGLQSSTATQCDVSGCRGEMLKIASINGNTATVTTAFHDTYDPANIIPGGTSPSNIGLGVTKFTNIVTGINIHDLAFDGSGTSHTSILAFGDADLTVSNISAKNFTGHGIYPQFNFNTSWTNINLSVDGCDDFGISFFGGGHNTVNGLTSSGGNGAWCGGSGGSNGLGVKQTADSTFANVMIDKAGTSGGRPMKLSGARYNTFDNLTVKNGPNGFNGLSVEYYSSHNTFNSPIIQGNQSCNGCGGAGVNMFGNYNQYNTFNTPTITGNGNVQFYQYGVAQFTDSHTTISGGTIGAGVNTGGNPVISLSSDSSYAHNAMISGPGGPGIGMSSPTANGCVNNNTFGAGTGLSSAISSNSSTNTGLGNILNGLSSNLTAGTCGTSRVSISPTAATVTSGSTQQFSATVTGSTNTAVTWSATAGSVSSSGLFTAPTVSTNTTVTVTATSQALTSQSASATVTVTPSAPPNTFGYAVQGANVGTTMSNSVLATRYQMVGQNGTVTSMSAFIASPVSASPNNQFQVAIYADNSGTPGALIASSVSQVIVPDAWNTVSISAPVTANAYYWLAYNTNGLAANTNNLRYDSGGATSTWITSEAFGIWPAAYGPIGGTSSTSVSMYATFQ